MGNNAVFDAFPGANTQCPVVLGVTRRTETVCGVSEAAWNDRCNRHALRRQRELAVHAIRALLGAVVLGAVGDRCGAGRVGNAGVAGEEEATAALGTDRCTGVDVAVRHDGCYRDTPEGIIDVVAGIANRAEG